MHRGYTGNKYSYSQSKSSPFIQEVFPEDIQCVFPSHDPLKGAIYVSNVQAAQNFATLTKFNIRAVLTTAKGYDRNIPKTKLEMYDYYPLDDKESCQISPYFERAANFIANALTKTNVLVHCIAGVSRSVSMVLAYLIRDRNMSYQQAYLTVKSRRKIISPNDGFIQQLKKYAGQKRQQEKRADMKTPEKKTKQDSGYSPISVFKNNYTPFTDIKRVLTYEHSSKLNQEDSQNKIENKSLHQQVKKSQQNNPMSRSVSFSQNDKKNLRGESTEEKKNIYNVTTDQKSKYFKKMNQDLTSKIQAIHAKYQRQRQNLLSKRNYSNRKYEDVGKNSYFDSGKAYNQNIGNYGNYHYQKLSNLAYPGNKVRYEGLKSKYMDMFQNKYSVGYNTGYNDNIFGGYKGYYRRY